MKTFEERKEAVLARAEAKRLAARRTLVGTAMILPMLLIVTISTLTVLRGPMDRKDDAGGQIGYPSYGAVGSDEGFKDEANDKIFDNAIDIEGMPGQDAVSDTDEKAFDESTVIFPPVRVSVADASGTVLAVFDNDTTANSIRELILSAAESVVPPTADSNTPNKGTVYDLTLRTEENEKKYRFDGRYLTDVANGKTYALTVVAAQTLLSLLKEA